MGRDWLNKLGLWPLGIEQSINKINRIEKENNGSKDFTNNNDEYTDETNKKKTVVKVKKEDKLVQDKREQIFKKYHKLFSPGSGVYNKAKFTIKMRTQTTSVFHKARTMPFAIKEKVSNEIDRLVKEKTITPVETSEWGTPIVPIIKPDGTVRICGDYKVTVNEKIITARHPLPRIEHLIANLQGGVFFSKIDLKEAYAQIPLNEDSKKYLVLNTHKVFLCKMCYRMEFPRLPDFFKIKWNKYFPK